ncbi:MAG: cytochrome b/b6 domain-containing protein [Pseudomonadota bacterium]
MGLHRVMIFSRFERFWHWGQALLIFVQLYTGFAIHGSYQLIDFDSAVLIHTVAAMALIVLWLLAIFWHLTTGTWRHYMPTTQGLWQVVRYYVYGIFHGERHPYHKAYWRKHNPLQALSYLGLKLLLFPAVWLSGLAYFSYFLWRPDASAGAMLEVVALAHIAAAYAIGAFVIIHLYLLTTGESFIHHLRPMLNGHDEVELTEAEKAYLEEQHRG